MLLKYSKMDVSLVVVKLILAWRAKASMDCTGNCRRAGVCYAHVPFGEETMRPYG